jgi:cyclin H
MSCYPTSTQRRHWILTREDIDSRRAASRARAIDAARDARSSAGEPLRDPSSGPEPLSDEEETLLRRYYEAKIMKVCAAFSLPSKVQATAVTLFKRFLLDTSLLQHNLKTIMLTSVYLACKTEEHYVSAEELGRGMHEDAGRVLNAELTLLAGLRFQLITYSPYRALEGFRHDFESEGDAGDRPSSERLDACLLAARDATSKQMLTDAPLMYAPGRLALAALRAAARESGLEGVVRYAERVGRGDEGEGGGGDDVARSMDAIDAMRRDGGDEPREEEVRPIDKKYKTWRAANANREAKETNREAKEVEATDGREGKRRKSASKAEEDAALDGP